MKESLREQLRQAICGDLDLNTAGSRSDLKSTASQEGRSQNVATFAERLSLDGHVVQPSRLTALKKQIEDELYQSAKAFSLLSYHLAREADEWGEYGRDQLESSFCRIVLKLGPREGVSWPQMMQFYKQVQEGIEENGFHRLSIDDLRDQYKHAALSVLGYRFSLDQSKEVNKLLRYIGSSMILQSGRYGEEWELIYAKGIQRTIPQFEISILEHEYMRSPNAITAMAALIKDQSIFIRRESIVTIFEQKWRAAYQRDVPGDVTFVHRLSEKIKKRVYETFQISSVAGLNDAEPLFLAAIEDNVLYHEIGHGVIQYGVLDLEVGSFSEACRMFGETIFTTILEVLADIAPLYQGGMGPLKAMAQHAVHDREAATARFYLYLSDVFFYDTQDMYMFPYSDFILAIMLCYMTPMDTKNSCFVSKETRYDGLIDFKQMSESVQIEETMVDWFVRFLEEAAASFQAYLATLIYTHQGGVMTWAQLRSHLKTNDSCAAEIDPSPLANGSTLGVYNHSVSMWSDLFRIALESEENKTKIRGFLQEVENRCQASFLKTWHPDTEELCLREFVQRKLAGLF